jgi:hypothetical protein
MSGIAKKAGLNRESLYKALGETGNPDFGTVMRSRHRSYALCAPCDEWTDDEMAQGRPNMLALRYYGVWPAARRISLISMNRCLRSVGEGAKPKCW